MKHNRYTLFLILLALLSGALSPAQAQRKYALLIASGKFTVDAKVLHPLPGTKNDLRLMLFLLTWKYGIPPANIYVVGTKSPTVEVDGVKINLVREQVKELATRDEIKKGFDWLKTHLKKQDSGVIYYTGHGGSYIDNNRITRATQYWVDYNGDAILDYEIHRMLNRMKNNNLTLLFDCCYGGGTARNLDDQMVRGKPVQENTTVKSYLISPEKYRQATERAKGEHLLDEDRIPAGSRHVLLSACSESFTANEVTLQNRGDQVGAFTLALYQKILFATKDQTFEQVQRSVQQRLRAYAIEQMPDLQGGRPGDILIGPLMNKTQTLPVHNGKIPAGLMVQIGVGSLLLGKESKGNRSEKPLLKVVGAGNFWATIRRADGRQTLPDVVELRTTLPFQKQYPLRIDQRIQLTQRRGNSEPDDIGPNKGADETVVISKKDDQYTVKVNAKGGESGAIYTVATLEEARAKSESLQRWLTELSVLRTWGNPIHPMGLTIATKENVCNYPVGGKATVLLQTEKPGYLLLVAFEQDGMVDILYPNKNSPKTYLTKEGQEFPITATAPAGEAVLTAFLFKHSFDIPEMLYETKAGMISMQVAEENRQKFMDWLAQKMNGTMKADKGLSKNFGVAVPVAPLVTEVDAATLVLRVLEN